MIKYIKLADKPSDAPTKKYPEYVGNPYDLEVAPLEFGVAIKTDSTKDLILTYEEIETLYTYSKQVQRDNKKYRVVALDTDFHEFITLASNLSYDEAVQFKSKYDHGVLIEPDLEV